MPDSTPHESRPADLADDPSPRAESSAGTSEETLRPARWRRWTAWTLVVVGALFLLVASFNVWLKDQALDTDAWVAASGKILADDEVRSAVAVHLVDELFDNVDVSGGATLPRTLHSRAPSWAPRLRH